MLTDIAELFARDPNELNKEDIAAVIEKFRESRGQFNLTGKAPGKTAKPKASAEAKAAMPDIDLGLDL